MNKKILYMIIVGGIALSVLLFFSIDSVQLKIQSTLYTTPEEKFIHTGDYITEDYNNEIHAYCEYATPQHDVFIGVSYSDDNQLGNIYLAPVVEDSQELIDLTDVVNPSTPQNAYETDMKILTDYVKENKKMPTSNSEVQGLTQIDVSKINDCMVEAKIPTEFK